MARTTARPERAATRLKRLIRLTSALAALETVAARVCVSASFRMLVHSYVTLTYM